MASRPRMILAGIAIVSVLPLVAVWIGARRHQSALSQARDPPWKPASANSNAMTRTQAVASAIGLFAAWTLATYLLEARLGTFLRPDATSRFVYTVVANVLIGTSGLHWSFAHSSGGPSSRASRPTASRRRYGFSSSSPWPLSLRHSF